MDSILSRPIIAKLVARGCIVELSCRDQEVSGRITISTSLLSPDEVFDIFTLILEGLDHQNLDTDHFRRDRKFMQASIVSR